MSPLFPRRTTLALCAAVTALVLSGCANVIPAPRSESSGPTPLAPRPTAFVGTWEVSDTDTLADGAAITFEAAGRSLDIVTECDTVTGVWAANSDGLFLGEVDGWSSSCASASPTASASPDSATDGDGDGDGDDTTTTEAEGAEQDETDSSTDSTDILAPDPQLTAWLTSAAQFTRSTEGITLYTINGTLAATLTPADTGGSDEPSESSEPTTAPLPDGFIAAETTGLVGTWVQVGRPQEAPTPPFIKFAHDGTWTGSDGCNGQSGRWLVGDDGAFLATVGPQTLMACEGMVNLAHYLGLAYRAGFSGTDLSLFDDNGDQLVRLVTEEPTTAAN